MRFSDLCDNERGRSLMDDEPPEPTRWVCNVCGDEYQGDGCPRCEGEET